MNNTPVQGGGMAESQSRHLAAVAVEVAGSDPAFGSNSTLPPPPLSSVWGDGISVSVWGSWDLCLSLRIMGSLSQFGDTGTSISIRG